MYNCDEYKAIQAFYGTKTANRSGIPLINHIDEGLVILKSIYASNYAKKAFCLHPLFQNDEDLDRNQYLLYDFSPIVIANVFEYRNIANAYLSYRKITNINEIRLSPLYDVNAMLYADKIQNYKDFCLYHKGKHPRSVELDEYFQNWFKRLMISEDDYNFIVDQINGL